MLLHARATELAFSTVAEIIAPVVSVGVYVLLKLLNKFRGPLDAADRAKLIAHELKVESEHET